MIIVSGDMENIRNNGRVSVKWTEHFVRAPVGNLKLFVVMLNVCTETTIRPIQYDQWIIICASSLSVQPLSQQYLGRCSIHKFWIKWLFIFISMFCWQLFSVETSHFTVSNITRCKRDSFWNFVVRFNGIYITVDFFTI